MAGHGVEKSQFDDGLEAAVGHALAVHDAFGFAAHGGEAFVFHDGFVGFVAVGFGFEDSPCEDDDFVLFGFGQFGEGNHGVGFHVVAGAFEVAEGAVFLPDFAGFGGDAAVVGESGFGDGEDESVDVLGHGSKGVRYSEGN